jgi:hypothetical protein
MCRQGGSIVKKGLIICIAFVLFLAFSAVSFAEESEFFVKTVPISKVYTHLLGYKVVYIKSDLSLGTFYVPLQWFTAPAAKGDLIWGNHPSFPYFSIFYKNGEFSHIRLYVRRAKSHQSWGNLAPDPALKEKFDIDTLELEF